MSEMNLMHLGIILLLISLMLYVVRSLWNRQPLIWNMAWGALLVSGLSLIGSLALRSQSAGYFALSNMYESLLVLSICLLFGFLVLDRWFRMPALGWPVCLLLLTSLGYALSLPTDIAPLQAALQSYWRSIHVPVILSSYAMFTLAFISSLVFLVRSYFGGGPEPASATVGGHAMTRMQQTHSLEEEMRQREALSSEATVSARDIYDEITYRCVAIGFPLLAIGIILGGLWANEAWGNYWSWDPKESMSLVTLLAYGVYLHLRVNGEHSPRTLAWVSVGGFVMMLVTYFGVNIMGLGLHSYGKIG